ncbi:MAG: hypothetical protein OXC68_06705 [Aestuariivita sp.]|nr:hypothetical protein [Aestuariivita sp.]
MGRHERERVETYAGLSLGVRDECSRQLVRRTTERVEPIPPLFASGVRGVRLTPMEEVTHDTEDPPSHADHTRSRSSR